MDKVRVVIADDSSGMRERLKEMLLSDPDVELVAEAGDGQGAINMARKKKPDVMIMDTNMPGTDGIWAIRVIARELPQVKIIAWSVFEDEADEALRAGACALLFKNASKEDVLHMIHKVATQGNMEIFTSCANAYEMADDREIRLTKREKDILKLIAEGQNNKQIAETLFISEKTVKNHLTSIFRKLDVRDRTQAALYTLKNGIV